MVENSIYKSAMDHSPVGFSYNKIIYDSKGHAIDYEFIEVNKSFESMVKIEAKDLIGKKISGIYENRNKTSLKWDDFHKDILSSYKDTVLEYYFDYSNKYYRVKTQILEKAYIIIYLTDITMEINETEKLNMFSDSIPTQVWYLSNTETYISANRAHADFVGYKKEDLMYKNINYLFSEKEARFCIEGNQKVFDQKKQIVVKSWLENSKGENRLLRITKKPMLSQDGEVDFVICSAEDITEEYLGKEQNQIKERILYSYMAFTQELLTNEDHYKALSNGIEMLGNATQVDRVYYWENHYDEDSKEWLTSQKFEWCLGNIDQQIDNPELQNIPFTEVGDFIEVLSKNKTFKAHVRNIDDRNNSTRLILESQDILSILVIPIFIQDEFKGFIGFDSCNLEKEWSEVEISLLNSFVLLYVRSVERNLLRKRLLRIKENFNNFFNMIDDSLFVLDLNANIIDVNDVVLKRFNYSRKELLGKNVSILHPKEDLSKVEKSIQDLMTNKVDFCHIPAITKDGHIFPVETRVSEGLWNEEKVIFAVSKDITDLSMSEEKFSKAFNSSGAAMFISKFETGEILEVNDTFLSILGSSRDETVGKRSIDLNIITEYRDRNKLKKDIMLNEGILNIRVELLDKNNRIRTELVNIVPLVINDEICLLSSIIDITDRLQYEEKLLDISNRDSLTGIYTRRYVYERAEEIVEEFLRSKNTFSIAVIDIDNFKNVNDSYGHQCGDYVLKEFTKIIGKNLRPYDILGRYGGEEFIVILNHSNIEESYLTLERILNVVRNHVFEFNENKIKLTFSAGVACCKEARKDEIIIDKLVEIADKRMYDGKNNGKNQIVYKDLPEHIEEKS